MLLQQPILFALKKKWWLSELKSHCRINFWIVVEFLFVLEQFNRPDGLRRHEQRYHSTMEKSYQCDLCPKAFFTQTELNSHLNGKHSEARNHSCDKCGKCFKDLPSLRRHYMVRDLDLQVPNELDSDSLGHFSTIKLNLSRQQHQQIKIINPKKPWVFHNS